MKHYKTLGDLHKGNGWSPPEHPLFSVVACQSDCTVGDREFTSDCYMIGFKKIRSGVILYGRTPFDHSNGSMLFVKPRQIIGLKNLQFEEKAFILFFHEDFLIGHQLHDLIKHYSYFDYETNEALHLSPKEETVIWELHDKIRSEYGDNPDEYSRDIILGHVASILMYAQRYYKRQFINRKSLTGSTATKFNDSLLSYYENGLLQRSGLPSVNMIANQMNISPRYLSDVLKQETGKTAIDLIHISIINEAKNLLREGSKGVTEIAYLLGFENSSYFTRLFKKQTGFKPLEFKKMILN